MTQTLDKPSNRETTPMSQIFEPSHNFDPLLALCTGPMSVAAYGQTNPLIYLRLGINTLHNQALGIAILPLAMAGNLRAIDLLPLFNIPLSLVVERKITHEICGLFRRIINADVGSWSIIWPFGLCAARTNDLIQKHAYFISEALVVSDTHAGGDHPNF
ncbi:hypothetical protein N431DRAFT_246444 [Stipitochalara longipes BDJ]|nr:hypothetical protein N431DRAFT_246444 [Stipitochalara longipes BDJ]